MDKELFNYLKTRAQILANSSASTQITANAARAWLDAVERDVELTDIATETFLDIIEGRPTSIEDALSFAQSPAAKELFGKEGAQELLQAARERKEQGFNYCGCQACTAASEILAKFGRAELSK